MDFIFFTIVKKFPPKNEKLKHILTSSHLRSHGEKLLNRGDYLQISFLSQPLSQ